MEKSVPRINNWQRKACQVMTILDRKGQIFLSHPLTNNGLIFLLTTKYLIYILKNMKNTSRNPEYAEMRHGDLILTLH